MQKASTIVTLSAAALLLFAAGRAAAGSSSCDIGQYWFQIPGSLSWVSSGDAGVWAVTSDGGIYHRLGTYMGYRYIYQLDDGRNYGFTHPDGTGWVKVDGELEQIDVGRDAVWGVSRGRVFYRTGISTANQTGGAWVEINELPMASVSVGDDGKVWGVVCNTGFVYRRAGVSDELPGGSQWEFVAGPPMRYVDVGGAGVWGVTPSGDVYYRTGSRTDCQGSGWQLVASGLGLRHVASGLDTVWGVSENGAVYFRLNITSASHTGSEFLVLPGNIKQLSVSTTNNALWAVDVLQNLFSRHQ